MQQHWDSFAAMTQVAIIGGGPAGLLAAEVLSVRHEVHLYEQGRLLGRKFLVAGDGGLNITNKAEGEDLYDHFTPKAFMQPMLEAFGPAELRKWLADLGVPTYVGSSGRVFPERNIKPAEVLTAMRDRLEQRGVHIHLQHTFVGFDEQVRPLVEREGERIPIEAQAVLFALGGASWPKTGSTGGWRAHFEAIGVSTVPFFASNCGVECQLPGSLQPHAGKPLKNVVLQTAGRTVRGEVTITDHGLEGNAIYPLVPALREALAMGGAELFIDLKPDLSEEQIDRKVSDAAWKERPAALRLDRPALALFKAFTPLDRYLDGRTWAHDIKHVRIPITALRPLDEAISTVGGIALSEVAPDLSLVRHPHLFVAGEMLDTDAPTGGFLLQGAFAMGLWAARGMEARVSKA
jgi:uncharacterized flavoprotein (TIGR03862 family)